MNHECRALWNYTQYNYFNMNYYNCCLKYRAKFKVLTWTGEVLAILGECMSPVKIGATKI